VNPDVDGYSLLKPKITGTHWKNASTTNY